jgi:hypothetical protein
MRSSVALAVLISGSLMLMGTAYSIYYNTWLDTSNPAITSLPHHLHATHYFANKRNPLNVFFIKRLWAWTSGAFLLLFFTSPRTARTRGRLYQFGAATATWAVFTSWFFGPALLERVIGLTGGECVVTLPSGYVLSLPAEYCHPGAAAISPLTHPKLFISLALPETETWSARPRLRRGHDISGHIFLLTLSALFLVNQVALSADQRNLRWDPIHRSAVIATMLVIALEFFSIYVTSVYFHSPLEKLSGFCE